MWKVLLQPCGDPVARTHFADTVETPVPVETIIDGLTADQTSEFRPVFDGRTAIAAWGVTPGQHGVNVDRWEHVAAGDTALFSGGGREPLDFMD